MIRINLRRDFLPARIDTDVSGKRNARARKRTLAWLASPSIGGAETSRRSPPAESNAKRSRAERGFTLIQKDTVFPSMRKFKVRCQ